METPVRRRARPDAATSERRARWRVAQRREFLSFALGGALAAAGARAGSGRGRGRAAGAACSVCRRQRPRRRRASSPNRRSRRPTRRCPSLFANLTFDQYASASAACPARAIWSDDNVGFALEPLHRGFIFTTPMDIYIVENGARAKAPLRARPTSTSASCSRPPICPTSAFPACASCEAIDDQGFQEVAIFQGASFFRAAARGQNFGVTARGLSIRTGDAQGEEFPLFRAVWIEKPTPATNALTIHALLDSASMTGAFRFTLRPRRGDDHRHRIDV